MLGKDLEHEFDDDAVKSAVGLLNKRANELEDELESVTDKDRRKAIDDQISELSKTADDIEDTIQAFKDAEELVGELREQVKDLEEKVDGFDELKGHALRGEELDDLIAIAAQHDPQQTEYLLLRAKLYDEAGDVRYDRALTPKPQPAPLKPKKRGKRGKRAPKVHPRQMVLFTEVQH